MKIALDQLSWGYIQSADPNFATEIEDMCISMGDRHVRSKQLKSGRVNLREVTHTSVSYQRYASERLQNLRVDCAHECSEAGMRVQILNHHDSRRGDRQNMIPPVCAVIVKITVLVHGWLGAANARRCRVANDRPSVLEDTTNSGVGEPGVMHANAESLDRACRDSRT